MATTLVRARVDAALKNEAAAVLAEMGLTVSDVVRIALTKIATVRKTLSDCRLYGNITHRGFSYAYRLHARLHS